MSEVALRQGKNTRTVHLAFDMALGGPEALPDLQLVPLSEDDRITVLGFVDSADGEMHYYVLNEDYRKRLVAALTGGIILGGGLNGTAH